MGRHSKIITSGQTQKGSFEWDASLPPECALQTTQKLDLWWNLTPYCHPMCCAHTAKCPFCHSTSDFAQVLFSLSCCDTPLPNSSEKWLSSDPSPAKFPNIPAGKKIELSNNQKKNLGKCWFDDKRNKLILSSLFSQVQSCRILQCDISCSPINSDSFPLNACGNRFPLCKGKFMRLTSWSHHVSVQAGILTLQHRNSILSLVYARE